MLYKVIQRVRRDSYKLQLPKGIELIHLVFHTFLLHPNSNNLLQGQHAQPQPLVLVESKDLDNEEAYKEWEINKIVDS